jgi:glycosyltransferase involved in cell wall biosynthesis
MWNPMIRVAALLDTFQVSGPGRQLAALASSLSAVDVELTIVTFHRAGRDRSPYLDYLEQAGVRYTVVPESGPLDLALLPRLRRVLAEYAPDVVQTHGYKPTALVWALRRRGAAERWIAFFHGATTENIKVRAYHWFSNLLLGSADRVVVMSRAQLEHFSRLGDKACVVHNAVLDLPTESPGSASARLAAGVRPRIGVVGRLSPEKGLDVFLHASAALARRGVSFSAVIAGDGPERARLEHLRDALGLARRVDFIGATSAVASLYASLDLLVIPSRSEGLPNVLLEALGADLPVVATRVGAIPEVLDDARAGLIVPPGSVDALADGIVHALTLRDDPDARDARRSVVEKFSLQRRVAEHLRLYGEVLRDAAGAVHAMSTGTGGPSWTTAP